MYHYRAVGADQASHWPDHFLFDLLVKVVGCVYNASGAYAGILKGELHYCHARKNL
jgi:hypothetical protein